MGINTIKQNQRKTTLPLPDNFDWLIIFCSKKTKVCIMIVEYKSGVHTSKFYCF